MPLGRPADDVLLKDRHQFHLAYELTDAFLVHRVAFVVQALLNLTHTEEGRLQELHLDQPHQRKALPGLALRRVVEERPRHRQKCALLAAR